MNVYNIISISRSILAVKQSRGKEQTYQNEESEAVQHLGFFVLEIYEKCN